MVSPAIHAEMLRQKLEILMQRRDDLYEQDPPPRVSIESLDYQISEAIREQKKYFFR